MERPRIVVIERRHYTYEEYKDNIESCEAAGYKVAFRIGSTNPEKGYTILEEV